MPRKYQCPICGRAFTSKASEFEHFKREHVGKLSKQSFEYALSVGITAEKLIEWCRRNGVVLELKLGQTTLGSFEAV